MSSVSELIDKEVGGNFERLTKVIEIKNLRDILGVKKHFNYSPNC